MGIIFQAIRTIKSVQDAVRETKSLWILLKDLLYDVPLDVEVPDL